jgi:hypothetical protein
MQIKQMLLIFVLLTLLTVFLSGITTVPFVIGLLVTSVVLFQKPWVFFLAFGLGLYLDLIAMRSLGYTSLTLTIFVFLVWLYERKFETQTAIFVFISTFLGSAFYLMVFGYDNILIQSLISAIVGIFLFKFLWLRLGPRSETI